MSFNWGSSDQKQKGTQTVILPQASAAEQELQQLNLQMAKMQIDQIQKAAAQAEVEAASPETAAQKQLQTLATQNLLARLKGTAPVLDAGQQAQLDAIYGNAQQRGQEDIANFVQGQAGSLGLSARDLAPLLALQGRKLTENLQAQRAASALDLSQAGTNFNQAMAQFQQGLQQQAYLNRLAIAGLAAPSYGYEGALFNQRLASAPRTSSGNLSGLNFGGGISGSDIYGYTGGKGLGWGGKSA